MDSDRWPPGPAGAQPRLRPPPNAPTSGRGDRTDVCWTGCGLRVGIGLVRQPTFTILLADPPPKKRTLGIAFFGSSGLPNKPILRGELAGMGGRPACWLWRCPPRISVLRQIWTAGIWLARALLAPPSRRTACFPYRRGLRKNLAYKVLRHHDHGWMNKQGNGPPGGWPTPGRPGLKRLGMPRSVPARRGHGPGLASLPPA